MELFFALLLCQLLQNTPFLLMTDLSGKVFPIFKFFFNFNTLPAIVDVVPIFDVSTNLFLMFFQFEGPLILYNESFILKNEKIVKFLFFRSKITFFSLFFEKKHIICKISNFFFDFFMKRICHFIFFI